MHHAHHLLIHGHQVTHRPLQLVLVVVYKIRLLVQQLHYPSTALREPNRSSSVVALTKGVWHRHHLVELLDFG